jgi:Ni,Fe-hydrogenase maturation factor
MAMAFLRPLTIFTERTIQNTKVRVSSHTWNLLLYIKTLKELKHNKIAILIVTPRKK